MATCEYGGELYDCSWSEKYILPIYDALDRSALADLVKESTFIVPWAGTLHLLALALIGGAVFMVDMRVLGVGLTRHDAMKINRTISPMMSGAIALAVISGSVLALGELMKLYYSPPYWMKMGSLVAALLFTYGVRNRVLARDGTFSPVTWAVSGATFILWLITFLALSNNLARVALLLLIAVLFLIVWFARDRDPAATSVPVKLVSAMSIILWLTTAAAGRWIAFY